MHATNNPFSQNFSASDLLIPYPSALEPTRTTPKVLKSLEDLTISQVKEQQAKDISATIKVTALEDKLNKKGINIAPVATVFDFTKFVHYKSEKERSTYAQVHQAFSNRIPSIRYLDNTNPSSNTAQQQSTKKPVTTQNIAQVNQSAQTRSQQNKKNPTSQNKSTTKKFQKVSHTMAILSTTFQINENSNLQTCEFYEAKSFKSYQINFSAGAYQRYQTYKQ